MSGRKPARIPSITSVMTPFPWFVDLDAPLGHARALMREHDIRHLPVTRGGALAGIVSAREIDLVESASGSAAARAGLTVASACRLDPCVVDVSARLDGVLREMAGRHTDTALVVKGGKLAGIFTTTDVCRSLGDLLETLFPDPHGDDAA